MAKKNTPAKAGTSKATGSKTTAKKPASKSSAKKTATKSSVKKDNKKPVTKATLADYKKKVLAEIVRMYKVTEAEAKKMLDATLAKEGFEGKKHPKSTASACKKAFDSKKAPKGAKAKTTNKDSSTKPKAKTEKPEQGEVEQVGADKDSDTAEEGSGIEFDMPKKEESVTVTAENVNDVIHGMANPQVAASAGAVSQAVGADAGAGHQGGVHPEGNAHPQSQIPQSAQPIEAMQATPQTNANAQAHLQNSIITHGETILGLILEDFRIKKWGGMPFNMIEQVVNRGAKEYLYEVKSSEKGAYFFIVVGQDRYRFPKDENEFIPVLQ